MDFIDERIVECNETASLAALALHDYYEAMFRFAAAAAQFSMTDRQRHAATRAPQQVRMIMNHAQSVMNCATDAAARARIKEG